MANASSGNTYVPPSTSVVSVAKNLIFDAQFVSDVDNWSALRIAAWAHKIGVINLLAVTSSINDSTTSPNPGPQLISQILTTAGVSGVAIASGPTTTAVSTTENATLGTALSQTFTPSRRLLTISGLSSSVPVLRQALSSATSLVDIVSAGPLNNLYDLLNSSADSISSLTGAQLVAYKVGTLYCMGGQYPLSTAPVGAEYNFGNISGFTGTLWPITSSILTNWPTPIVFVGFEQGPNFSVMAFASETTTDPVGYIYNSWGTAQFGRQGWGPVTMLIALRGATTAGFGTVQGTNSINTGTGFNTFTPGPGNHSYVVPTISQRAVQQMVDSICLPGLTQPTIYNGVSEIISTSPSLAGNTAIDAANLIVWYYAPDINISNGASVSSWPDRCGRANLVQATGGLQPTYNTALVSEIAVSFGGSAAMVTDASFDIPHNFTVYAFVESADLSTTNRLLMAHGAVSGSTDIRGWQLGRTKTSDSPASSVQAQSVIQNTFSTAFSGSAISVNTWCVVAMVRNGNQVTAYLNGVAGTPVTITAPGSFDSLTSAVSNHILGTLTMGAQFVNGTPAAQSPWSGGVKEVRVYNNAHSAGQVASVSTQMTT